MNVYIKGKNRSIFLDKNDFIASGGQASVYCKGGMAYKIYNKISDSIPINKIHELSYISEKNIIKPIDILLNDKNDNIGYTMDYVKNTYSLCQLFTKSFKQRNNISHNDCFKLVQKIQNLVKHIHEQKILIVDLNELNVLVNDKFKDVYFIDVDSYQTPSYPATAIMDSIRDRHSPNVFSENTDWFSFGIIAFQMFIGIHPYKGKHSSIKNIDERMLKNISVFNKDVDVPKVCYDFDVIPKNYENWFKAVFEKGMRCPPPFSDTDVIQLVQKIKSIIGSNNFNITELIKCSTNIVNYLTNFGNEIIITDNSTYLNKKDLVLKLKSDSVFGFTPKSNHPISAYKDDNGILKLFDVTTQKLLNFDLQIQGIMNYDNRIYAKSNNTIVEIIFNELGVNITPSAKIIGQCIDNNSIGFYQGTLIQNLIGTYYVSIFPKTGMSYQLKMDILNGYRIIDAKFDNNILMVVAIKNGKYDRFVFRFDSEYKEFDMKLVKDIQPSGLNFVVLDNGICAFINEDEEVELFSNKKDSVNVKVIKDNAINSDMKLFKNGTTVMFSHDNKLFSLKMK